MIALKKYRVKKGYTQTQVAEALGVVPSCVTQWESGVRNPDGSSRVTRTTKVTGKGQQYFINLFLARVVVK